MREVWGSNPESDAASPKARHRCDVSSKLCCPGAKPRRWAPFPHSLRASFSRYTASAGIMKIYINSLIVLIYTKKLLYVYVPIWMLVLEMKNVFVRFTGLIVILDFLSTPPGFKEGMRFQPHSSTYYYITDAQMHIHRYWHKYSNKSQHVMDIPCKHSSSTFKLCFNFLLLCWQKQHVL